MSGLRPGDLPSRFKVRDMVGQGRSATVWRVRDTRSGTEKAVKVIQTQLSRPMTHGLSLERLEREARSLARLRGVSGIVQITDVGSTLDRIPWFAMDYMSGGSLAQLSRSTSSALSGAGAKQLFIALSAAHDHAVVHGDISPSNILVDAAMSPHLADFGMSWLAGSADERAGVWGMTPAFAAPERLRGAPPSAASDVYSLASSLIAVGFRHPVLEQALSAKPSSRGDAGSIAVRI